MIIYLTAMISLYRPQILFRRSVNSLFLKNYFIYFLNIEDE